MEGVTEIGRKKWDFRGWLYILVDFLNVPLVGSFCGGKFHFLNAKHGKYAAYVA